jgi:3-hydroxyisobutyrate dehydrogenase-like beta-hydroxyacid dehydrogenase
MSVVRIGFVGTGLMGVPMIRNLVAAGFEVQIYARDRSKVAGLPGVFRASVQEAVSGTDALCSIVTDSPDVQEVVGAALEADSPPPLVIEMSTIAPHVAMELADACAGLGISYLDCPVSGGPPGAEAGTLAVMCGGDVDALDRAAPILDVIGEPEKRFHCGPVGSGLVVKLVNNLLVGTITAATAESLAVAKSAGVDPLLVRDVLMGATAGSWQLANMFPKILAGDHSPGFKAKDLRKDLAHAQDLAGRPLPLGDVAADLYRELEPDLNYGAVARRFLEDAEL